MIDQSGQPFPRLEYPFPLLGIPPQLEELSLAHQELDSQAYSLSALGTPGAQRELADALGQFLRASDWLASLRVLLSRPMLLTEYVSKLLHEGAEVSRVRGNTADEISMLTHLAFLEDVRRRGFFAVLNELQEKNARH